MSSSDNNDFSSSFTDLMTSLAIAFLILAVAMIVVNALSAKDIERIGGDIIKQHKEVTERKLELLNKIKDEFDIKSNEKYLFNEDNCVEVDARADYRIVMRFSGARKECLKNGLFFNTGESILDRNMVRANISKISRIFDKICTDNFESNIEEIQVLGHTDEEPYGNDPDYCLRPLGYKAGVEKIDKTSNSLNGKIQCGNLYLSAQRARTVYLLIAEDIIKGSKEGKFKCFKDHTKTSGLGPFLLKSKLVEKENFSEASQTKGDSSEKLKLKVDVMEWVEVPLPPNDPQHRRVELIFDFKQPQVKIK